MVVVISYSQFMVWSPQPANPQPADHILPHSGMEERITRAIVRKCVRHGIKAVLKWGERVGGHKLTRKKSLLTSHKQSSA